MNIIAFLSALLVSYVSVPAIIAIAQRSGAVSIPGRRHIHKNPTPKLGGVSIALGIFIPLLIFFPINRIISMYLLSSLLILVAGVIDDIKESNWKLKFVFSVMAVSIVGFYGKVWITNLGNLFGTGEIGLLYLAMPFTFFAVFGVINAINLIDGLNGLACGVSVIAFVTFAVLAFLSHNITVFYLGIINVAATLGLFRYNYPKASIFMGDSGSLFLGFSLSIMAILLTQGSGSIDPMIPVLVLAIPIFDTIRVMSMRISKKKHPFIADKMHLHHLLMRSGIPAKNVVKVIWALSILMSVIAVSLREQPTWVILTVFMGIIVFFSILIRELKIIKIRRKRSVTAR
jgi:UDP-GlcNAc:undecaprenyl-phosphate GlcNAc-1-phosphate transferase